jgi:hypothetical protein
MLLRRFLSAFPALALVVLIAAFAARPALAQEIDEDTQELSLFARILGAAGLLSIPGPGIDYQERPGLVVPPTVTNIQPVAQPQPQVQPQLQSSAQPDPWNFNNRPAQNVNAVPVPVPAPDQTSSLALPPPLDPNAVRQNPDFPVDPEIRAAKKAKAAKKTKGPSLIANDPFYGGRVLRGDELKNAGPRGNPGSVSPDNPYASPSRTFEVPVISNIFGKKKEEGPVAFTGETPRQTLTQPPSGYLTPSANAPYGVVSPEQQQKAAPTVHPNMPDAVPPQNR